MMTSSRRHFLLLEFENLNFFKLYIAYHLSKFKISWLSGSNFIDVNVIPNFAIVFGSDVNYYC